MLFGDITKQIKDITDDNKVTDKVLDQNGLECLAGEKEDLTEVVEILEVTTNTETKDTEMCLF